MGTWNHPENFGCNTEPERRAMSSAGGRDDAAGRPPNEMQSYAPRTLHIKAAWNGGAGLEVSSALARDGLHFNFAGTCNMLNDALTQTLTELEASLHRPEVRRSRQRLDELLHPEFEEVGRSGRSWPREGIIEMLIKGVVDSAVVAQDHKVVELQPGVVLLTYRSAHLQSDGTSASHTLRSSIWVKARDGWQMRYHQGTPSAEPW